MTKKQLFDELKELDDDAEIHIFCASAVMEGGVYAVDVYTDDIVSGLEFKNEATIVAHF